MSSPSERDVPMPDAGISPASSAAPDDSDDRASYRQIFKATSIIGGAQVVSIVIGVARTKVFALLLGPAGVGLLGLLNALLSAAGIVAQMGMGAVGTRQIAEAHASGDRARIALARRALMVATLCLSVIGGGTVWLLREPLATYALRDAGLATAVGWIGLGVALSVAAVAQAALIQGMRRMWELALLQIGGALLLTIVGLPVVLLLGVAAVPFYVILMPLSAFVLGHVFVARLEKLPPVTATLPELAAQWRVFIAFGLPMMGAAVVGTLTTLWIQAHIKAQLGIDALGLFVAANTIAMQYAGLVLTAMAGDYFPRLSGVINDKEAARRLVNQQTEVALLLAGPIILVMFAAAPLVISLLYSDAFTPAADVLRWQTAGTLLKIVTWPMGFILLAEGAGRVFFVTEVSTVLVMAVATAFAVDHYGLAGAGIGYFVSYVFYLPMMFIFAAPRIGLRWSGPVLRTLAIITAGLAAMLWPILAPSTLSLAFGAAVAGAATITLAVLAARVFDLTRLLRRFRGATS